MKFILAIFIIVCTHTVLSLPPPPPPPFPPHGSFPPRPPFPPRPTGSNFPTSTTSTRKSETTQNGRSNDASDPLITSWKKSTGNGYNNIVNNVDSIQYSSNYVYVHSNSIPAYSIGPWKANPNNPTALNFYFKFPRKPTPASQKTSTPLGHMGILINGVSLFNPSDAFSYNNQRVWNRNAYYNEKISFDSCNGHPAPNGEYHNHIDAPCMYDNKDSTKHSPLIGWLFDGYPLYGPFGYSNPNDASSSIKRMAPSYRFRNITQRTSLPSGTILSSAQWGPDVSNQYPIGNYLEDYEYVANLGDLDEYNGRFCKTPEFPNGIYAYFVASDSANQPIYPYLVGPKYYGTVVNNRVSNKPTEPVTTYYTAS